MQTITYNNITEDITPIINLSKFILKFKKFANWFLGVIGFAFIFFPLYIFIILPLFVFISKRIYNKTKENLLKEKENFNILSLEKKFEYFYSLENDYDALSSIKKIKTNFPFNWFFIIFYKYTDKIINLYSNYKTEYINILYSPLSSDFISDDILKNFEKFNQDWNSKDWIKYDMQASPENV